MLCSIREFLYIKQSIKVLYQLSGMFNFTFVVKDLKKKSRHIETTTQMTRWQKFHHTVELENTILQ